MAALLEAFIYFKTMCCARPAKQKQTAAIQGAFLGCFLAISAFGQADSGLCISELFPRAQADCPEWLELANTSDAPVNLRNWKYGHTDDTCLVSASDFVIPAGGYAVLTKDKAFFSSKYPALTMVVQPVRWKTMDNYHDTLFVWDSSGVLQECAGWDSRWFNSWSNQSLARVSFLKSGCAREAWVVATLPSPGQPNPDAQHRADGATLDLGPVPFTPNNDGKDDFLSIRITFPATASASVSVYGFDGRKYLDLPQPPPLTFQYLWNGTLASGAAAPVGPFFVVAEITGNGTKQMIRKKGVLWR
jgi:hypothetical protein